MQGDNTYDITSSGGLKATSQAVVKGDIVVRVAGEQITDGSQTGYTWTNDEPGVWTLRLLAGNVLGDITIHQTVMRATGETDEDGYDICEPALDEVDCCADTRIQVITERPCTVFGDVTVDDGFVMPAYRPLFSSYGTLAFSGQGITVENVCNVRTTHQYGYSDIEISGSFVGNQIDTRKLHLLSDARLQLTSGVALQINDAGVSRLYEKASSDKYEEYINDPQTYVSTRAIEMAQDAFVMDNGSTYYFIPNGSNSHPVRARVETSRDYALCMVGEEHTGQGQTGMPKFYIEFTQEDLEQMIRIPYSLPQGASLGIVSGPPSTIWDELYGLFVLQSENALYLPKKPETADSDSSSDSSGGSGGSGGNVTAGVPAADKPAVPTAARTAAVQANASGQAVITQPIVSGGISSARLKASKDRNTANGIETTVPVRLGGAAAAQITLKADALDALQALDGSTTGDLILRIEQTETAAAGSRPAYRITLWERKDGAETQLTSLNGKVIRISIPYTPAQGESTGNLYAVRTDGNGQTEWLTKSGYDPDQTAVIFVTGSLGTYGVGYKTPVPAYTDVSGHWAKEHILFAAGRGLFPGAGGSTFSPNAALTKGVFVTALGRLAGVNPANYQVNSLTDVTAGSYYAPYANWAVTTGIVSGTGAAFEPDSQLTWEQVAVIVRDYMSKMGYSIPKTLAATAFADQGKISSPARDAVRSMQQAGILPGKSGNRFDPQGRVTRAQAAAVLHRLTGVLIDPQTANGWMQNDSSQWGYYQDGILTRAWALNK